MFNYKQIHNPKLGTHRNHHPPLFSIYYHPPQVFSEKPSSTSSLLTYFLFTGHETLLDQINNYIKMTGLERFLESIKTALFSTKIKWKSQTLRHIKILKNGFFLKDTKSNTQIKVVLKIRHTHTIKNIRSSTNHKPQLSLHY